MTDFTHKVIFTAFNSLYKSNQAACVFSQSNTTGKLLKSMDNTEEILILRLLFICQWLFQKQTFLN